MSAPLMQCIAFRELPPHLKGVLIALANYARDDGTSCRPSLATVAAWTGRSLPRTKVVVRELRRRGFLVVTRPHAPHRPAEYRLALEVIEALPSLRAPQQLSLFSTDSGGNMRDPQADRGDSGTDSRFAQISTDVHRSPMTFRGIAGDPRSVKRSVYRDTSTSRAREPKKASAR